MISRMMYFNPDHIKEGQEDISSRKSHKPHHPPLKFNKATFKSVLIQKYIGLYKKRKFTHHLKEKVGKPSTKLMLWRKWVRHFSDNYLLLYASCL